MNCAEAAWRSGRAAARWSSWSTSRSSRSCSSMWDFVAEKLAFPSPKPKSRNICSSCSKWARRSCLTASSAARLPRSRTMFLRRPMLAACSRSMEPTPTDRMLQVESMFLQAASARSSATCQAAASVTALSGRMPLSGQGGSAARCPQPPQPPAFSEQAALSQLLLSQERPLSQPPPPPLQQSSWSASRERFFRLAPLTWICLWDCIRWMTKASSAPSAPSL
mmetsp:Transcript_108641/g.324904  ORF Transcript_108641/g.324904 Transcript_108641/m.324904 type:complete len:222 (-) Transcript_108641:633-1298(-)